MDADSPEAQEHPSAARPMAEAKAEQSQQTDDHERGVEEREAFESWGYMFKPDKTGTDKLKALLRGLKNVIVCWPSTFVILVESEHTRLTHSRMNIMSRPTTQI